MKGIRKVCEQGHVFYKSSDCPVCPTCEGLLKPGQGFLSALAAPARRALASAGIHTLKDLSRFSKTELLQLHGLGPGSLPKLESELKKAGLALKAD